MSQDFRKHCDMLFLFSWALELGLSMCIFVIKLFYQASNYSQSRVSRHQKAQKKCVDLDKCRVDLRDYNYEGQNRDIFIHLEFKVST